MVSFEARITTILNPNLDHACALERNENEKTNLEELRSGSLYIPPVRTNLALRSMRKIAPGLRF